MLEIKLDTKRLREPKRFFKHWPPSHFLRSLFKLPHHVYGRVSITIESNCTLNLRGFILETFRFEDKNDYNKYEIWLKVLARILKT